MHNPFIGFPPPPATATPPTPSPPASKQTVIDSALADSFAELRQLGRKPSFTEVLERAQQRQPSAFE